MLLLNFQDKEGLFIEHRIWSAVFTGQHHDNPLLEHTVVSPRYALAGSRNLSTVPCHVLSAWVALLKTCLLYHGIGQGYSSLEDKTKAPLFEAELLIGTSVYSDYF